MAEYVKIAHDIPFRIEFCLFALSKIITAEHEHSYLQVFIY